MLFDLENFAVVTMTPWETCNTELPLLSDVIYLQKKSLMRDARLGENLPEIHVNVDGAEAADMHPVPELI
jgi:hypothetical protein